MPNGEVAIKAKREFYDLMMKNKEKGLLDDKTVRDLRKLGVDLEYREREVNINDVRDFKNKEASSKNGNTNMMVLPRLVNMYKEAKFENKNDSNWKPDSTIMHKNDFYLWINSMTFGRFSDKIHYEKFEIYKAQAQYWCDTFKNPYDTDNLEERKNIILSEYNKIDRNTLYFAMQYYWIAEGSVREGRIRYVPKEHNAVILYMLDCDYLFILGKGRQIFATTTMGIYVNKKLRTQENFFMTFITADEKKGMGILEDKIKSPNQYFSNYLKPTVDRDYIKGYKFGKSKVKGDSVPPNSRIEVLAPTKTAINSSAPQIVLIDEAAEVPDLIPIILEQRPTLYMDLNQDGNLTIKRKILLWSTGVSSNKGKMAYYSLWSNVLKLWEEQKFEAALFVPLFFSWDTRCNEKVYKDAQVSYYNGDMQDLEGLSFEERKQLFFMHYPSVWTDMFAMVTNKIVPNELIEKNQRRIRDFKASERPITGRFEPVYDYQSPLDDVYGIPYRIIGSRFVPTDDCEEDMSKVSCTMALKPENWENRYYQGTDPIETDTGQSNFASVIIDKLLNKPACVLNYRPSYDTKDAFIQAILMSIYYDANPNGSKHGVPELIENNIGTVYKNYKELIGYDANIIYNKELPLDLQGGGSMWGVNTRQKRKQYSVSQLTEYITNYAENIDFDVIFKQINTYVPVKTSGGYNYEPADKRLYKDDVLDALAFAYIASKIEGMPPRSLETIQEEKKKFVTRPKRLPNGDYMLETVRV